MKEQAVPIETILGVLRGRDCIYLDATGQDNVGNITFTGEINGALVGTPKNQKEWIPYKLTFQRVLACFSCELDTYDNLTDTDYLGGSSFDLIENSEWLHSLPVRKDFEKSRYQHYRLFTYDIVYNVIAVSYQIHFL